MELKVKYFPLFVDGAKGEVVEPLVFADDYSKFDCFRAEQVQVKKCEWAGEARQYEFTVAATDVRNNRSTSPTLTVLHGI